MSNREPLIAACKAVTCVFPEVDHLFISVDARWLFCDDSFNAPQFDGLVDISLLEDMIHDICNGDVELPIAFYIPEVLS